MRRNPGLRFMRWELESPSFKTYIEFRKGRIKAKYIEFQKGLGLPKDHDGEWSIEKEIERTIKSGVERSVRGFMDGDDEA